MIDWVSGKVVEVTDLVQGASVLGAIVMVAVAYYKTRTLVAVVVAGITAGVFLWTINNTSWFQDRVAEETGSGEIWDSAWEFQEDVSAELDVVFAEIRSGLEGSDLGDDNTGETSG